jgi:hypothetical protein
MTRKSFLKRLTRLPILSALGCYGASPSPLRSRVPPSDPDWPEKPSWEKLKQTVDGRLIKIEPRLAGVLVVDSSDKIHVKSVTLGRDFGTKSEVLGGLDATDRVIQNPTAALHEGMLGSVERATQGLERE